MDLVLFDLDNTLLAGDSDFEWAQFLMRQGVIDRAAHEARNRKFYADYEAGTLDIEAFLAFQLAPLAQHPRAQLDAWHLQFMTEVVTPMIAPGARTLIARHRAEGALMAIVTATNSFVTGPIARHLGIEHLVATIAAQADSGALLGKPSGLPAFRDGKIRRVNDWLMSLGLHHGMFARRWFYSDSHNDLPLLMQVSDPVAVDPDERLRDHALAHQWPIISLRG